MSQWNGACLLIFFSQKLDFVESILEIDEKNVHAWRRGEVLALGP
jgi:hypothetical protein